MRKFILSVLLLLLAAELVSATEITVGFENLESVCGGPNYSGCSLESSNPYRSSGLSFTNAYILNNTFPTPFGFQSMFPFGSYYMYIPTGDSAPLASMNFIDFDGVHERFVSSVSFLVLGKAGDVISGTRPGSSGVDMDTLTSGGTVKCKNVGDCTGYLSGFDVVAYGANNRALFDVSVEAVNEGWAGYNTSSQDFANYRVTLSVGQGSGGFSKVVFNPTQALTVNGTPVWGAIAIDQITFDQSVPEPGTFVGAGVAITALVAWHRRRTTTQG